MCDIMTRNARPPVAAFFVPPCPFFRYHSSMADPIVETAYAYLRRHYSGDLRFDEHFRPVRYVFAPDGALVTPVMAAMLASYDTVLFVPECVDDALEVQVTAEQFDEQDASGGALADRWRIYHGEPEDVYWAKLVIDAARFEGHVIDGEALMRENPLGEHESTLCRSINTDHRDDLKLLCEHFAQTDVAQPIAVGLDALGLDVRRKFDCIRIPFDKPQESAEQARSTIAHMIRAAHEAAGDADTNPDRMRD